MYDSKVVEKTIINGINVNEKISTTEDIKNQPELAKMQFRASNKWVNGAKNQTSIRSVFGAGEEQNRKQTFVLEKDEPEFLMGEDTAANPVEHLLAALAGCLTTLVFFASAEGVRLNEVTSKLEADDSLLGFLDLDENERMGCDEIRVTFDIKSDAPREKIQELVELAQARSGVFDMLVNKTPVAVRLA